MYNKYIVEFILITRQLVHAISYDQQPKSNNRLTSQDVKHVIAKDVFQNLILRRNFQKH